MEGIGVSYWALLEEQQEHQRRFSSLVNSSPNDYSNSGSSGSMSESFGSTAATTERYSNSSSNSSGSEDSNTNSEDVVRLQCSWLGSESAAAAAAEPVSASGSCRLLGEPEEADDEEQQQQHAFLLGTAASAAEQEFFHSSHCSSQQRASAVGSGSSFKWLLSVLDNSAALPPSALCSHRTPAAAEVAAAQEEEMRASAAAAAATLEAVLNNEQFPQELHAREEVLMRFLSSPAILMELVELLTSLPKSDASEARKSSSPFYAAEVFCFVLSPVVLVFLTDPNAAKARDKFWDFLKNSPPLNPVLAGYFARCWQAILKAHPQEAVAYLAARGDVAETLSRHLYSRSIAELYKSILYMEQCVPRLIDPCSIVPTLVALLRHPHTAQQKSSAATPATAASAAVHTPATSAAVDTPEASAAVHTPEASAAVHTPATVITAPASERTAAMATLAATDSTEVATNTAAATGNTAIDTTTTAGDPTAIAAGGRRAASFFAATATVDARADGAATEKVSAGVSVVGATGETAAAAAGTETGEADAVGVVIGGFDRLAQESNRSQESFLTETTAARRSSTTESKCESVPRNNSVSSSSDSNVDGVEKVEQDSAVAAAQQPCEGIQVRASGAHECSHEAGLPTAEARRAFAAAATEAAAEASSVAEEAVVATCDLEKQLCITLIVRELVYQRLFIPYFPQVLRDLTAEATVLQLMSMLTSQCVCCVSSGISILTDILCCTCVGSPLQNDGQSPEFAFSEPPTLGASIEQNTAAAKAAELAGGVPAATAEEEALDPSSAGDGVEATAKKAVVAAATVEKTEAVRESSSSAAESTERTAAENTKADAAAEKNAREEARIAVESTAAEAGAVKAGAVTAGGVAEAAVAGEASSGLTTPAVGTRTTANTGTATKAKMDSPRQLMRQGAAAAASGLVNEATRACEIAAADVEVTAVAAEAFQEDLGTSQADKRERSHADFFSATVDLSQTTGGQKDAATAVTATVAPAAALAADRHKKTENSVGIEEERVQEKTDVFLSSTPPTSVSSSYVALIMPTDDARKQSAAPTRADGAAVEMKSPTSLKPSDRVQQPPEQEKQHDNESRQQQLQQAESTQRHSAESEGEHTSFFAGAYAGVSQQSKNSSTSCGLIITSTAADSRPQPLEVATAPSNCMQSVEEEGAEPSVQNVLDSTSNTDEKRSEHPVLAGKKDASLRAVDNSGYRIDGILKSTSAAGATEAASATAAGSHTLNNTDSVGVVAANWEYTATDLEAVMSAETEGKLPMKRASKDEVAVVVSGGKFAQTAIAASALDSIPRSDGTETLASLTDTSDASGAVVHCAAAAVYTAENGGAGDCLATGAAAAEIDRQSNNVAVESTADQERQVESSAEQEREAAESSREIAFSQSATAVTATNSSKNDETLKSSPFRADEAPDLSLENQVLVREEEQQPQQRGAAQQSLSGQREEQEPQQEEQEPQQEEQGPQQQLHDLEKGQQQLLLVEHEQRQEKQQQLSLPQHEHHNPQQLQQREEDEEEEEVPGLFEDAQRLVMGSSVFEREDKRWLLQLEAGDFVEQYVHPNLESLVQKLADCCNMQRVLYPCITFSAAAESGGKAAAADEEAKSAATAAAASADKIPSLAATAVALQTDSSALPAEEKAAATALERKKEKTPDPAFSLAEVAPASNVSAAMTSNPELRKEETITLPTAEAECCGESSSSTDSATVSETQKKAAENAAGSAAAASAAVAMCPLERSVQETNSQHLLHQEPYLCGEGEQKKSVAGAGTDTEKQMQKSKAPQQMQETHGKLEHKFVGKAGSGAAGLPFFSSRWQHKGVSAVVGASWGAKDCSSGDISVAQLANGEFAAVGMQALELLTLVKTLLKSNALRTARRLLQLGVADLALELLFLHPWNTLLHLTVGDIVQTLLQRRQELPMGLQELLLHTRLVPLLLAHFKCRRALRQKQQQQQAVAPGEGSSGSSSTLEPQHQLGSSVVAPAADKAPLRGADRRKQQQRRRKREAGYVEERSLFEKRKREACGYTPHLLQVAQLLGVAMEASPSVAALLPKAWKKQWEEVVVEELLFYHQMLASSPSDSNDEGEDLHCNTLPRMQSAVAEKGESEGGGNTCDTGGLFPRYLDSIDLVLMQHEEEQQQQQELLLNEHDMEDDDDSDDEDALQIQQDQHQQRQQLSLLWDSNQSGIQRQQTLRGQEQKQQHVLDVGTASAEGVMLTASRFGSEVVQKKNRESTGNCLMRPNNNNNNQAAAAAVLASAPHQS